LVIGRQKEFIFNFRWLIEMVETFKNLDSPNEQ
jgi:hypothetical protein